MSKYYQEKKIDFIDHKSGKRIHIPASVIAQWDKDKFNDMKVYEVVKVDERSK